MSGYELRAAITEVLGHFWHESYGQIYPCLAALEEAGAVRRTGPGGTSGTVVEITDVGEARLRELLAEPHPAPPPATACCCALFFGTHLPPGGAQALLRESEEGARAALDRYARVRDEVGDDESPSRPCARSPSPSASTWPGPSSPGHGSRWRRSSRSSARPAGARCPRVTPSTAPPSGCTAPCRSRRRARRPALAVGARRRPARVAHASRSSPAASTCSTVSTPASTLHTHLRMEGQWRVEHPGAATDRALRRHDLRAAVLTDTWSAVGLRLGMLDLVPTAREADLVGHLGPDVLGPDWDPDLAAGAADGIRPLRRRPPARPARARRGGHVLGQRGPLRRARAAVDAGRDLDRATVDRVLDRLHRLMDLARRTGWQASTGVQRAGAEAYVHARSGRPCRRCGDTVRVAMTGEAPRQRTLFSCPTCQAGLAPTDDGRPQRPLGSRRA